MVWVKLCVVVSVPGQGLGADFGPLAGFRAISASTSAASSMAALRTRAPH